MWTRKLSNHALASFAFLLLASTTATDESASGCGDPPACSCSWHSAFDLCVTCCGDVGQAVCPSGGACKPGLHYDASTLHCEQPCSWGTSSFGNCCGDVGQVICDTLSGYGSCKPELHYDGSTTHCELPCAWGTSSFGNCCGSVDQVHCDPLSGFDACKPDLAEGDFTCRTPRVPGESCGPDYPCKDGSTCNFALVDGALKLECVLDTGSELVGDADACKAFYSADIAPGAVSGNATLNFGVGAGGTAGIAGSIEEGVFYTADSQYGCYVTTCYGVETNVGVAAWVVVGESNTYADFKGHSFEFNQLAGEIVAYINSQGWGSESDFLAGEAPTSASQAIALDVSVLPISVGFSECETITQVVVGEETQTPPVARCKPVEVVADASSCVATGSVDDGSYSATAGVTVTTAQSPAGPYPIGPNTVTLTATDSNGLTATCTAVVQVRDLTPPTLTCPADVTVANAPGRCEAEVTLETPAANDTCSAVVVSIDPASGTTLPVGATVVTGQAVDGHDNSARCTFTATVVDGEAPGLVAPPDMVVDATGPEGAVVTYPMFGASDNCGVGSVTSEPPSGSVFPIDPTPADATLVTGTATDAAGNVTTATFTVHVKGGTEQLQDLLARIEVVPRHEGLEQQVVHALGALEVGWTEKACHALWALLAELSERSEEACAPWGLAALTTPATRLRAVLACAPQGDEHDDGSLAASP